MEIQKQDSHFPTAPMACGARKKLLKVSTMRPVRCVYHAPVLTHTRVNAGIFSEHLCSQEYEHGTHECRQFAKSVRLP